MSDPLLDELFAALRAYLHVEKVDHVLFALACAVAARIDRGDPLWGLLIGPASSGKTEVIRMLDLVADEHPDEITAPSLLSWSKGKDPHRVGILARLSNPGLLTVADFSTVLATSDRGGRDQLFAMLRRVYDGAVSRDLGNSPRALTWQGRVSLLAGCTPIIDNYSSHADALGPRWLYCRIDSQDSETKRATGRKALGAGQLSRHRTLATELAASIVDGASRRIPQGFDLQMEDALLDAAIVACYGRGAVERDGYGHREISSMAVVEEPPRLAGQLALMARALLALRLDAVEAVALCRRCALDSIPQARRGVLAALAANDGGSVSDVARLAGSHRHVARMALEELEAIGVTSCDDPDTTDRGTQRWWMLAGPDEQLIRRVLLAHERAEGLARKVGGHSQISQRETKHIVPSHTSCQVSDDEIDPDGDVGDLSLDDLDALEQARGLDPVEEHFPSSEVAAVAR